MSKAVTARDKARQVLSSKIAVFDTETTGLSDTDEIVEIAIIDNDSNILYHSLVKPKKRIPEEATKIHGITNYDVQSAPEWQEIHDSVLSALSGRTLVAYNKDYDMRMIAQSAEQCDIDFDFFFNQDQCCVMELYCQYINKSKWQKLINAATKEGVITERTHRALNDGIMTLALLKKIAGY